jgi:hypothetical protein
VPGAETSCLHGTNPANAGWDELPAKLVTDSIATLSPMSFSPSSCPPGPEGSIAESGLLPTNPYRLIPPP